MAFSRKMTARILVAALGAILLALGFDHNAWGVVREKKFETFQNDSESLVMARLVAARQYGLTSYGALMGWGDADPLNLNDSDYQHQYDVYFARGDFQTYSVYKSQTGFQAFFFSLLDRLSPLAPRWNLRLFRGLMALLLALTLSIFILWIYGELGWFPALIVFLTTLISPWITLFGRNLLYFTWAFYLPMVLTAFYLAWEKRNGRASNKMLGWLVFAAVAFKCLFDGYDFIIPSLAMVFIPLIYYGLLDHWGFRSLVTRSGMAAAACAGGVVAGIVMLAFQLRFVDGSFGAGLADVLSTFGRRTYGDPSLYPAVYADSLRANPLSVLATYLFNDYVLAFLNLDFFDLILIAAVFTGIYVGVDKAAKLNLPDKRRSYAWIGATWVSVLSPISWFVIFKGQAYVHTHTNYLAWYMPFTLFAFALCAFIVGDIFKALAGQAAAAPKS
ncbi:MAG TPA: hypothetical protein VLZ89_13890 [Anaerolineales bacterium]|nr:hypothetical protein [Anaerolineales bacterium]